MRPKVFFSYTTRDGFIDAELMKELNSRLSPLFSIFIDLIHNDSEKKQERVLSEVRCSNYLVVLNTPLIEKSDWVKIEVDEAKKLGIPVLYTELIKHNDLEKNLNDIIQFISRTIK